MPKVKYQDFLIVNERLNPAIIEELYKQFRELIADDLSKCLNEARKRRTSFCNVSVEKILEIFKKGEF